MTVQEILSKFLTENNLSYRGLAELLTPTYPVTQAAIGHWMTGEWKPSVLRLRTYRDYATDERVKKLASDLLSAVTPATVDPICIQDSTE